MCVALIMAAAVFVILDGSEPAFAAGKVKLSKTSVSMKTGGTAKLTVKNAKAAKKKVKWTSGDTRVVKVTKKSGKYKQKVTLKAGKKAGETWVRAKAGKKTLICRVTVTAPEREIKILPLSDDAVEVKAKQDYAPATETDLPEDFKLAYSKFAVQLLQATLQTDPAAENVLISPDSVMTALTMTGNGAVGTTRSEMLRVLTGGGPAQQSGAGSQSGAALSADGLNDSLWKLHSRLTGSKGLIYTCNNSIWTKRGLIIPAADFLNINKKYHNASLYESSFGKQGAEDMNRWVYNNTRNMIDQIIDPENGLSEDARMVLINAIAFEGKWLEPFNEYQIKKDGTFTAANGAKQKATMLQGTEDTYVELAGGTGFVKDYAGGDIAFLGLLPPKGMSAREYAAGLSGEDFLAAWQARRSSEPGDTGEQIPIQVRIQLPCFSYDYGISMKPVLQSLGMKRAFTDAADFSAMMDPSSPEYKDGLCIDDVLHKTHIELDQNGTKAAAVTAVIVEKATAVRDVAEKEVFLDRPFAYALVDTRTGAPLFIGIVESIQANAGN